MKAMGVNTHLVTQNTCSNAKKSYSLRKKCPYSEFFWSVFFWIGTEYGKVRSISSYSVRMRENTDQKNSEYKHFSRSGFLELFRSLVILVDI